MVSMKGEGQLTLFHLVFKVLPDFLFVYLLLLLLFPFPPPHYTLLSIKP